MPRRRAIRVYLACFPDRSDPFLSAAAEAYQVTPVDQEGSDLGERMWRMFRDLSPRHRPVVIVGSDSPHLPAAYLEQAFAELEKVPLVLGPAEDGGYYLIGATGVPDLFEGIAWGTERVLRGTLQRALALRLPCRLLPTWYDIDDPPALDRLARALAEDPSLAPETAEFLRARIGTASR